MSLNTFRIALSCGVLLLGCTREPLPPEEQPPLIDDYTPPEPVQLTPPPSVIREPGEPTITPVMDRDDIQMDVAGHAYRPMYLQHGDAPGHFILSIASNNEGDTLIVAESDYHILPTATAHEDGRIMICWNTLTGEQSEYSEVVPDPARGMALHCRMLEDGELSEVERIRAPTVGCWIQQVIAMPDGRFRLVYKGDDGWFSAEEKPNHGTYSVFYDDGRWSTPELRVPVRSILW